jgi:hypothetical protein
MTSLYIRSGDTFTQAPTVTQAPTGVVLDYARHLPAEQFRPGAPILDEPHLVETFLTAKLADREHEVFALICPRQPSVADPMVVGPGVEFKTVEGHVLRSNSNLGDPGADFAVEVVCTCTQVERGVTEAEEAREEARSIAEPTQSFLLAESCVDGASAVPSCRSGSCGMACRVRYCELQVKVARAHRSDVSRLDADSEEA